MPVGITHFDDARSREFDLGHLRGRWTALGDAAGSVTIGARRIELPAGGWSTPAHDHGRSEEIFFVISGSGLSWQAGATAAIGAGDCIVYRAGRGAHTLQALEPMDVLAFGTRERDASLSFPRLDMSLVGGRMVASTPGLDRGVPAQHRLESALGAPGLPPEPSPRPATIVNLADVEPETTTRLRTGRTRRRISRQAGSERTGLQHVEVAPGRESAPPHCHSIEEEMFVVLAGEGVLVLDRDETPVRAGHVISRPAGTGVAHQFRADEPGLTYLAYGTRESGDVCYYPRSNKIAFRGVGVMARLERLEYWDGED